MDSTLSALGELVLKAAPTILLVILLHFYLKFMLFKPMAKTLRERFEATEGARQLAEKSMERATAKASEYEAAMRAARAELYRTQEQIHKKLQEQHAADLAAARRRAEEAVGKAKTELAEAAQAAKATLARDADALSVEIADSILGRSAA